LIYFFGIRFQFFSLYIVSHVRLARVIKVLLLLLLLLQTSEMLGAWL